MRSSEFESKPAVPQTADQARLNALKKQKEVASTALASERKRQALIKAQKQIVKQQL